MDSKGYFEQVAHQWDEMRAGFFSESVREKAFDVSGIRGGQVAADIGAGTGFVSEGLLKRGVRVIAIDRSAAMLAEMGKKLSGDIDFRLGESEHLPIGDDAIDYAFANMYLHHVESPSQAIKEMVRILKPGGKLVITDLDEHQFEFLKKEHHDRWMGFKREDVRRWCEESGLAEVMVDCAGGDCCAQSSCGSESAKISIFLAAGQKGGSGGNAVAL